MVLAYIRALDTLNGRLRRQEGQALVEYALIISLVAIFLIGALTFMRGKLDSIFTHDRQRPLERPGESLDAAGWFAPMGWANRPGC